jgi:hypothetical protein
MFAIAQNGEPGQSHLRTILAPATWALAATQAEERWQGSPAGWRRPARMIRVTARPNSQRPCAPGSNSNRQKRSSGSGDRLNRRKPWPRCWAPGPTFTVGRTGDADARRRGRPARELLKHRVAYASESTYRQGLVIALSKHPGASHAGAATKAEHNGKEFRETHVARRR